MSRTYGKRYVVQMRSSLEGGSYKAAHRRHGLASVITIKWRALCGAPRYSCIVMAIEGGWIYATMILRNFTGNKFPVEFMTYLDQLRTMKPKKNSLNDWVAKHYQKKVSYNQQQRQNLYFGHYLLLY